jgi:hypothetical protein
VRDSKLTALHFIIKAEPRIRDSSKEDRDDCIERIEVTCKGRELVLSFLSAEPGTSATSSGNSLFAT